MEWWLVHLFALLAILVATWLLRELEGETLAICVPYWIIIIAAGVLFFAGQLSWHWWSTALLLLAWPTVGVIVGQRIYRETSERTKWSELPAIGVWSYLIGIPLVPISIGMFIYFGVVWVLERTAWRKAANQLPSPAGQ